MGRRGKEGEGGQGNWGWEKRSRGNKKAKKFIKDIFFKLPSEICKGPK